jgi:hypothetical protein
MVDYAPGIDISKRLQRQPSAFFFLVDPGGQRLFYDPATGTFQPSGDLIEFVGE